MEKKQKFQVEIKKISNLTTDIVDMWIQSPMIAEDAKAGQFLSLYCKDGSRILPRPISICEVDKEKGWLRLVFRIAGKGTEEFSTYKVGDKIEVMGPLGNGFTKEGSKVILVGGGIGIPPLLQLAKELTCEKQMVLGYRNGDLFLKEEFELLGKVYIATEDGSHGTKGNVVDAMKENKLNGDLIFSCGPTPMLRGIKAYASENGIKAQISMEEKMACGIGACLACVCQSKERDPHSNVNNKRICKDGPVFYADEIEL
ncbi:MAG: dihydroorotate dehydrogenase electron transfer subunit [Acetivibrio sp.]